MRNSVALLIVVASVSVLSACAPSPTTLSGSPTEVTSAPSVTPSLDDVPSESPATMAPQQADVFSVSVGDCLDDSTDIFLEEVPLLDCAAPHDLEVFDEFQVEGAVFDPVSIGEQADTGCTSRFESFIGVPFDSSLLDVVSYKPTAESWITGDRLVSCMVGDPSGKTTGTLRGALR